MSNAANVYEREKYAGSKNEASLQRKVTVLFLGQRGKRMPYPTTGPALDEMTISFSHQLLQPDATVVLAANTTFEELIVLINCYQPDVQSSDFLLLVTPQGWFISNNQDVARLRDGDAILPMPHPTGANFKPGV